MNKNTSSTNPPERVVLYLMNQREANCVTFSQKKKKTKNKKRERKLNIYTNFLLPPFFPLRSSNETRVGKSSRFQKRFHTYGSVYIIPSKRNNSQCGKASFFRACMLLDATNETNEVGCFACSTRIY
jgi:hypothetical protein